MEQALSNEGRSTAAAQQGLGPGEPTLPPVGAGEKPHEWAAIIRSMSQHEDALVNNRFTWFSTLQGLLFAGLAVTWKERAFTGCCLAGVICLLGFIIAVVTDMTIRDAEKAHKNLRKWWKTYLAGYNGPGRTGNEIDSSVAHKENIMMPWLRVPLIFGVIWVIILGTLVKSWYRSTGEEPPTVMTLNATQATVTIQPFEQPAQKVTPSNSAEDTSHLRHTITRQKSPASLPKH